MIWRLLGISGNQVSLYQVTAIHLVLRFYTLILPRAVVASIRWNKYRQISKSSQALALLTLDLLANIVLLCSGVIVFSFLESEEHNSQVVVILASSLAVVLILLFLALFVGPHFFEPATSENGIIQKYLHEWTSALRSLRLTSSSSGWIVISCTFSSYVLFLLSSFILSRAMGMDVSLMGIVWVRSAIMLMAYLPFAIAGLGVREVGFISLFAVYGVSPETAFGYAATSFLLQVLLGLVGAILELQRLWRQQIDETK